MQLQGVLGRMRGRQGGPRASTGPARGAGAAARLGGVLALAILLPSAAAAPMWSHKASCLPVHSPLLAGCASATIETTDARSDCAYRDAGRQDWVWTCTVTIHQTLCAQGKRLFAYLRGDRIEPWGVESSEGAFNCAIRDTVVEFVPEEEAYNPRLWFHLCLYVNLTQEGTCATWRHDVGPMPRAFALSPSPEAAQAVDYATTTASWAADYAQDLAREPL